MTRAAALLSDVDLRTARSHSSRDVVLTNGELVRFKQLEDGTFVWLTNCDLPSWMSDAVHDLQALSALEENWDSYGARPISAGKIDAAFEVLLSLSTVDTPRPHVVPTVGGGVQLEWHTGRADLEVEVVAPFRLHVLWDPEDGEPKEIEVVSDFESLRGWVAQLV